MRLCKLTVVILVAVLNITTISQVLARDSVGLMLVTLDSPFYRSIQQGAQKEADRLGYNLHVLNSDRKPLKEQNNAQDLVVKGVKVLLVQPINNNAAIHKIVTIAKNKGIPVVVLDAGHNVPNVSSTIAADSRIGAKMAGDFIAQKLGKGARVIQLEGPAGATEGTKRKAGLLMAVKEHQLSLLASQPADYDRTKGLNVMQNLLVAYPDVQAIFAQNDEMALGALSALQVSGRTDVLVVGFDGTSEAVKAVKSGKMAATVDQQPELLGKTSVMIADKIIKGKKVPQAVTIESRLITY